MKRLSTAATRRQIFNVLVVMMIGACTSACGSAAVSFPVPEQNNIKAQSSVRGSAAPAVAVPSEEVLFQLHKPTDGVKKTAKVQQNQKVVALTFDDGPDARYTPAILDILQANHVKATFFVVGVQVKAYPQILKRINAEGHLIGNHTYHHIDLAKATKARILEEIGYNDALIEQIVGFTPTIIRPPYGAITASVRADIEGRGREVALWNIDTRDWAGTSVKTMRAQVNQSLRTQSVILMHSFGGRSIHHTVEVLPLLIKDLKSKGYTFVTYDEMP